ncbi:glycosyltransferase [Propionibacterium australiense]|nr:glycosyltransferase family 2 protein [Propionibacterium australiense]RLP08564.1 glycosyltransferase [Propionibacterium australiense]RLP08635.1 glycosyltransferase [Propionibacterium australiense]
MTGRVSVCMATWNGARFVEAQLASILSELGPADEVIVVDDASSDNTVELVQSISDPRVKVFPRDENKGYVRTFEEALTRAGGDYLFLSDQDDVWVPGRVRVMVQALQENQVVASNLSTLDGPERIPGPFLIKDWHVRSQDSRRNLWNLFLQLAGLQCYWGCAMAVRRDALEYLLPFPDFLIESHDQWIGLCANMAGSIVHCDERTIRRRYHGDNLTPAQPRGVLPALRSRWMLIRCLGVARLRGLGRPRMRSGCHAARSRVLG